MSIREIEMVIAKKEDQAKQADGIEREKLISQANTLEAVMLDMIIRGY